MTKCQFYRTEMVTARAHAAHSGRREPPPQRRLAGYCAHEFSPVDRSRAVTEQGGATLLACGGDLAKCPITDKL
ncbi:MAG: hypothetical protein WCS20_03005 [Alphaproteobacteria bacterium]|jgi:hypothetical protein